MPSLLIMDDDVNHRRILGHVLKKLHDDIEIAEHTSAVTEDPDHIPDIDKYDLVLIDTTLQGKITLPWMMAVIRNHEDPPEFIILSSIPEPNPAVMQQLVIAIRNGVRNFHFKKKLNMPQLMKDVSGALQHKTEEEMDAEEVPEEELTYNEIRQREAMQAAALALDSLQGYKQWPFTIDAMLAGEARMGRYHVTEFLGEDNTSSTFKASVESIKVPIALKIINRLRVEDNPIPERFVERFRTIATAKHPNVIRLLGHEVVEGRVVVALEFLHGGTLEDKLKAARLDDKLAIHYFRQLLEGMITLHDLGLELHQIVPRQLMFRDENTLVITQIGLLNTLHALSEIAGDWPLPFTTPIYTTPENVHKQPTDQRSDIYLAGIIGYEMLAGKPPFASGSDQDIMYAHIMEPTPALPDAGHKLNGLLADMLNKMPEKRPTAKEALAELNKLFSS